MKDKESNHDTSIKSTQKASETHLSDAFNRLNNAEDIAPPASLDALILKEAATASVAHTASSNSSSAADTVSSQDATIDIKFRRQQLDKEREKLNKRKSFLPVWAMPMALAATVLLSFGVVTRVMNDPSFMQPIGSEYLSESAINNAPLDNVDTLNRAKGSEALLSDTNAEVDGQVKTDPALKDTFTVPDSSYSSPDIIAALQQASQSSDKTCTSNSTCDAAPITNQAHSMLEDKQKKQLQAAQASAKKKQAMNSERKAEVIAETLSGTMAETRADFSQAQQRRTLIASNSDTAVSRERSHQSITSETVTLPETIPASIPVPTAAHVPELSASAKEQPQHVSPTMTESTMTTSADAYSGLNSGVIDAALSSADSPVEEVIMSSEMADDLQVLGSRVSEDEIEEIILTGRFVDSAQHNSAKQYTYNVNQEILFADRQCQSDYDCSLVSRDCERCDCVETINKEKLDQYEVTIQAEDIQQQCLTTKAECLKNYCVVSQK